MNKREMVHTILEKGILISPGLLDRLNEETLQSIIMDAQQNGDKNGIVVDQMPDAAGIEITKKQQPEPAIKEAPAPEVQGHSAVSIEIRKPEIRQHLTPEDFVRHYNNQYGALRDILLKKTNAVSINKLNGGQNPVTVIGMVKEKAQNSLKLEDPTGQAEIALGQGITNGVEIENDDVLAVTGNASQGKIAGKSVTFPDVPLTHPVGSLDAKIILTENMPNTAQDIDATFTPSSMAPRSGEAASYANPAHIKLSKDGKALNMLIFRPDKDGPLSDAVKHLKKRHLPLKPSQVRAQDPFLIDPIPDIFWFVCKEKGIQAYKGVTVVSCGPNAAARIDLNTRKVEFILNDNE
jgi:DNA polymerase II small subunit/DNA polymerase delta subunit B